MVRQLSVNRISKWELGIYLNGACLGTWDTAYAPTDHAVNELLNEIEETYGKFTAAERAYIAKEIREY